MRIDSVRFDASGNATLVASGGISFFIPVARIPDIPDGLPTVGDELEDEDSRLVSIALIAEEENALLKALALCSRAEQSSQGLRSKLANRGFSRSATEFAVHELESRGILDDSRYALIWARSRAEHRLEGPRIIGLELRARGFSENIAKSALDQVDFESILAKAFDRLLKGKLPHAVSRDEMELIARSLRLKGFKSDAISKLIENLT